MAGSGAGYNNKAPLYAVSPRVAAAAAMLLADFNSMAFDWVARLSVGGTNMSFFILKQLPVLPPAKYLEPVGPGQPTWAEYVAPRVLELTYTAHDVAAFARDLGWEGPPFIWDEERRFQLRCELDAAFFHLYLGAPAAWQAEATPELLACLPTPRAAVEHMLEAFPIVKRRDEETHNGRYRTRDAILECYDRLATFAAGV